MLSKNSILSSLTCALMFFPTTPTQVYSNNSAQKEQQPKWYQALNDPPKQVNNHREIKKWIQQNKGFGVPQTALLESKGKRVFVVWVCPFSGRAAVYAFAFTKTTDGWSLSMHRLFENTHDLHIELDEENQEIVYKSVNGKVLFKQGL